MSNTVQESILTVFQSLVSQLSGSLEEATVIHSKEATREGHQCAVSHNQCVLNPKGYETVCSDAGIFTGR